MRVLASDDLRRILMRIDGRGYKAYHDLRGTYELGPYLLDVAHVQGDPYAPPSRVHVHVSLRAVGLEDAAQGGVSARIRAMEDFLGRCLSHQIRGQGAGDISIDWFGQEVLLRTAVRVRGDELEARLFVHLPAAGRRILGRQATHILLDQLPEILSQSLEGRCVDLRALSRHQDVVEDHAALAGSLEKNGWVAFVANDALLPRRAGHDDRPMREDGSSPVIRFRAPRSLEREVTLPHAGKVRGMAIPRGVTLLVGGGFHGKSTLLEAISRGIYAHIPDDGRERVASDPLTVKVRAEDGRAVTCTDISPFIGELPYGRSTRDFGTQNASGSTSQAANIVEALEAGARVLLLDEDTSATNFMIRDEPMRRLLKPGQEPITPFLDRVRNLYTDRGVSTVLVVGGSGEYFRVADRVIQMDRYLPEDVTALAKEISPEGPTADEVFPPPPPQRRFRLSAYRRQIGPKGPRVKAHGTKRILVQKEEVDLSGCEQLVSSSQTRTLGEILQRLLEEYGQGPWAHLASGFTTADLQRTLEGLREEVLDGLSRFPRGDLAEVRAVEVIAMINRLRGLAIGRS
ncbi:MAG: ABC-ATPase domain-containing protein [Candidatus Eisenbacteria sp.]|nr:ABC-ATPase domain-containing protein [Candidatus Eisenbacteria bacterium]